MLLAPFVMKKIDRHKHPSLFCPAVSEEEEKRETLTPV
jgi:hypothetical protein